MIERASSVDALSLYHDLWDIKLRAERKNRTFLVYLLQVALQDLQGELAAADRASSAAGDQVSAE